ncbi:PREDICTED: uncharacterized protein LOC106811037 [Priapulus caudatus]|uniref:Uncharacterized protein LOC106811037 n=1 Tax=Priapulus caudatus TaxID=37621 RepID=A0ABM1ECX0_PRICU|nr:PREDICTED: uncharacterized protein LOC106811037 [Priapulus caudatus]
MDLQKVQNSIVLMQKSLECAICLELLNDPVSTRCDHQFCRGCLLKALSCRKNRQICSCPLCNEPITKRSLREACRLGKIAQAVQEIAAAVQNDTGIEGLILPTALLAIATEETNNKKRISNVDSVAAQLNENRTNVQKAKRRRLQDETPVYIEPDADTADEENKYMPTNTNIRSGFPVTRRKRRVRRSNRRNVADVAIASPVAKRLRDEGARDTAGFPDAVAREEEKEEDVALTNQSQVVMSSVPPQCDPASPRRARCHGDGEWTQSLQWFDAAGEQQATRSPHSAKTQQARPRACSARGDGEAPRRVESTDNDSSVAVETESAQEDGYSAYADVPGQHDLGAIPASQRTPTTVKKHLNGSRGRRSAAATSKRAARDEDGCGDGEDSQQQLRRLVAEISEAEKFTLDVLSQPEPRKSTSGMGRDQETASGIDQDQNTTSGMNGDQNITSGIDRDQISTDIPTYGPDDNGNPRGGDAADVTGPQKKSVSSRRGVRSSEAIERDQQSLFGRSYARGRAGANAARRRSSVAGRRDDELTRIYTEEEELRARTLDATAATSRAACRNKERRVCYDLAERDERVSVVAQIHWQPAGDSALVVGCLSDKDETVTDAAPDAGRHDDESDVVTVAEPVGCRDDEMDAVTNAVQMTMSRTGAATSPARKVLNGNVQARPASDAAGGTESSVTRRPRLDRGRGRERRRHGNETKPNCDDRGAATASDAGRSNHRAPRGLEMYRCSFVEGQTKKKARASRTGSKSKQRKATEKKKEEANVSRCSERGANNADDPYAFPNSQKTPPPKVACVTSKVATTQTKMKMRRHGVVEFVKIDKNPAGEKARCKTSEQYVVTDRDDSSEPRRSKRNRGRLVIYSDDGDDDDDDDEDIEVAEGSNAAAELPAQGTPQLPAIDESWSRPPAPPADWSHSKQMARDFPVKVKRLSLAVPQAPPGVCASERPLRGLPKSSPPSAEWEASIEACDTEPAGRRGDAEDATCGRHGDARSDGGGGAGMSGGSVIMETCDTSPLLVSPPSQSLLALPSELGEIEQPAQVLTATVAPSQAERADLSCRIPSQCDPIGSIPVLTLSGDSGSKGSPDVIPPTWVASAAAAAKRSSCLAAGDAHESEPVASSQHLDARGSAEVAASSQHLDARGSAEVAASSQHLDARPCRHDDGDTRGSTEVAARRGTFTLGADTQCLEGIAAQSLDMTEIVMLAASSGSAPPADSDATQLLPSTGEDGNDVGGSPQRRLRKRRSQSSSVSVVPDTLVVGDTCGSAASSPWQPSRRPAPPASQRSEEFVSGSVRTPSTDQRQPIVFARRREGDENDRHALTDTPPSLPISLVAAYQDTKREKQLGSRGSAESESNDSEHHSTRSTTVVETAKIHCRCPGETSGATGSGCH